MRSCDHAKMRPDGHQETVTWTRLGKLHIAPHLHRIWDWLGQQGRISSHLAPTGTLLEAVTDLVRGLPHSQVLLHIPAVVLQLLQLHAQGEILSQGVLGGPASVPEGD